MRRTLVLFVVAATIYGGAAPAQTATTPSFSPMIELSAPRFFIVANPAGKRIATIDLTTGTLTFGDGMRADVAARETWRVLARAYGVGVGDIRVETCVRLLMGEDP